MLKELLIVFVIAALTVPILAYADPQKEEKKYYGTHFYKGPGNKYDKAIVVDENDRVRVKNYYTTYYEQKCPPGLARKHNGCLPPGQVTYKRGDTIPTNIQYYSLPAELEGNLKQYDDAEYVQVNKDIYLINPETRIILDIIALSVK